MLEQSREHEIEEIEEENGSAIEEDDWSEVVLEASPILARRTQSSFRAECLAASTFALRLVLEFLNALVNGGDLVRQVGPGLRPLERHEFESPHRADLRRLSGGGF